jgi:GTP-binding protein
MENKKILIDAGCETMPGFVVENFENPIDVIERKGIRAEHITDIVLTHSHHDHVQCVGYFQGAIVHIQEDELVEVTPKSMRLRKIILNELERKRKSSDINC